MVLSGSGRSPPPPTNRRIRLSYGTAASHPTPLPPSSTANNTTTNGQTPPGTNETNEDDHHDAAMFLSALSPSTAKYLKSERKIKRQEEEDENTPVVLNDNDETVQLRTFVKSLLDISSTPDYASASFYATALYSKSHRIDDAYLAARALLGNGEEKRAVWILEAAGLLLGGHYGSVEQQGDVAAGSGSNDANDSNAVDGNQVVARDAEFNNAQGIRASLRLRIESALLAGQCLINIGEIERALTVYSEAMRYPPCPPESSWGAYGYGYVLRDDEGNGIDHTNLDNPSVTGGNYNSDSLNGAYIRQWREQSFMNSALIDEGDDPRLFQLAENVAPLAFETNSGSNQQSDQDITRSNSTHPLARLCAARGKAYDSLSNPHRAIPFLKAALQIDKRCIEAWDYVIRCKLLTPVEEREWYDMLHWGITTSNDNSLNGMSWLKDAYLIRLRSGGRGCRGSAGRDKPPSTVNMKEEQLMNMEDGQMRDATASSDDDRQDVGLQTPGYSLGTPIGKGPDAEQASAQQQQKKDDDSVDQAFCNLALTHHLGKSSDVLALAAIRSYASHNLQAALTYCTAIDTLDPFCRTAGYVYVATLVGLGLKRRLFQLAHRLVDADPKDALAWFAVGSYYHVCGRHDLSQRHFSRSTRLDPSSAECWIGFGCSFAICDESDQALASFRAAQGKYSGSHIPLLYMGMEYLRTNHLSLAGHFLASSQKTDPSDPLCCNELGVWAFRRGDLEDAEFWFVKALRLYVEAEASLLTCADEALGANGYILLNTNVDKSECASGGVCKVVETPVAKSSGDELPPSTVLCAIKTPSGQSIAAYKSSAVSADDMMTDLECVDRCKDIFWEPSIYNLGQVYRKLKRYSDAIACFQKCSSLNPVSRFCCGNYHNLPPRADTDIFPQTKLQGSAATASALGFARHLSGDIDGAIDSYHEALSRKPDDPFSTEMLNRALSEAVTYPKSSVFDSDMFTMEVVRQTCVIGRGILPRDRNVDMDVI
eukprot:scaffold20263_cov69-Cyclotella_meneghiniana.AAC.10